MECISISHKTADSGEREKFYIPKEKTGDFLQKIRAVTGVKACVILSTCNRTEIYVEGEENRFCELEKALGTWSRSGALPEDIREKGRFTIFFAWSVAWNPWCWGRMRFSGRRGTPICPQRRLGIPGMS